MRFEDALKAMREGKKVKHSKRPSALQIYDGKICEVYNQFGTSTLYDLEILRNCEIMREDWEVVDD